MSNTLKALLIVGTIFTLFVGGVFLIGPAMVLVVAAVVIIFIATSFVKDELDRRDRRKRRPF